MATFRKGNYVADLGALVVTGLGKQNKTKKAFLHIIFESTNFFLCWNDSITLYKDAHSF